MPYDPLMRWETEGGAIDPANGYKAEPEEVADNGRSELLRWFGHAPARLATFRHRDTKELGGHVVKLRDLRRRARAGTPTLIYGAPDRERSNALVLAEILRQARRPR